MILSVAAAAGLFYTVRLFGKFFLTFFGLKIYKDGSGWEAKLWIASIFG